jgi:hypothetical protein
MGVVQPPSRAKREAKKFESFALGVAEPPPGQMGVVSATPKTGLGGGQQPLQFYFFKSLK